MFLRNYQYNESGDDEALSILLLLISVKYTVEKWIFL